jgi:hypothetical protein
MKHFENQIPILLEFRGMENPVTVTLPQPVMRYLDIYADRQQTHAGEVIYKQGERDRVMPACLLPRRISNSLRP